MCSGFKSRTRGRSLAAMHRKDLPHVKIIPFGETSHTMSHQGVKTTAGGAGEAVPEAVAEAKEEEGEEAYNGSPKGLQIYNTKKNG